MQPGYATLPGFVAHFSRREKPYATNITKFFDRETLEELQLFKLSTFPKRHALNKIVALETWKHNINAGAAFMNKLGSDQVVAGTLEQADCDRCTCTG